LGKIKRLAGETVLYGLGSILPRFLNFLLVKLHTEVFSPDQYGVITNLYAYVAVINIIFIFGMETAYFRFANKPEASEQKIFNLTQTVVVVFSLFFSVVLITLATPVSTLLEISGHSNLVIWLVIIMFIDAVAAIPFARLRHKKQPLKFAIGKLINITLFIGLNVYLLLGPFEPSISFVVIANLIANAFYVILFFKTLISWRPQYDREISPQMFHYAYPIMITGLAGMTNEMFSRITLKQWLPPGFYPGKSVDYALGIFGACYKLAVLMNLAIMAFRYAAEPFFFSNAREKNSPQLFAKVNHYFIIICCLLLLGVGINLDILKHFLDKDYWEGLHIVPVLLLAYLFVGIYYNLSVWFKLTDKTYYGTIITVGGALITILANYILIPIAGYEGSSWATLFCYFAMTVTCYWLGQRYYPIPYNVSRGMAYILGTTLLVYIVNSITIESQFLAILFHATILGLYVLVVYLLERKEFRQVRV
jgi:O-antigen/teichoic acid export membrane protein